jgi:homoserine dehydrogenase
METIRVALLGAGNVGGAFAQLLPSHQARFKALGVQVVLGKVWVRDTQKPRPGIDKSLLTTTRKGFLDDVDVLVEVAGGTGVAEVVLEALEKGIPVITANKALLAECWEDLKEHAESGDLHYEASVMAGSPLLGMLQSLWGNHTISLHGIVNGTCSYIIQRLEQGFSYAEAFAEADNLGYLEADPSLDVGGIDAAHKICVLGRLTVDPDLAWSKVRIRGIEHLTPSLIQDAKAQGQAIRLVASLFGENGAWSASVRPVKLGQDHPLVAFGSGRNALVYTGDPIGQVVLAGPGAGGKETASGVLGDLYKVLLGLPGHLPIPAASTKGAAALKEVSLEEV